MESGTAVVRTELRDKNDFRQKESEAEESEAEESKAEGREAEIFRCNGVSLIGRTP